MSRYVRAIPRTGYSAQIYQQADPNAAPRKVKPGLTRMKHEVWETLTPKGKEICAHVTFGDRWALISANNLARPGATAMRSRRRAVHMAIRLQLESALAAMERGWFMNWFFITREFRCIISQSVMP